MMSAASSLAEIPERLEKVFKSDDIHSTNGISNSGIYALNFYALMMPVTVTIDDRLPFEYEGNPFFAKPGYDKSVWGPLLEKAFAKFHGSYEALAWGSPLNALNTLAGAPGHRVPHPSKNATDLWYYLRWLDSTEINALVSVSNWYTEENGLMTTHIYTFLKVVELSDGTKLVQLRNPYGIEGYYGPWSDKSELWTE